jgi:hypothetical protein
VKVSTYIKTALIITGRARSVSVNSFHARPQGVSPALATAVGVNTVTASNDTRLVNQDKYGRRGKSCKYRHYNRISYFCFTVRGRFDFSPLNFCASFDGLEGTYVGLHTCGRILNDPRPGREPRYFLWPEKKGFALNIYLPMQFELLTLQSPVVTILTTCFDIVKTAFCPQWYYVFDTILRMNSDFVPNQH